VRPSQRLSPISQHMPIKASRIALKPRTSARAQLRARCSETPCIEFAAGTGAQVLGAAAVVPRAGPGLGGA
jgi:hypothetical protein